MINSRLTAVMVTVFLSVSLAACGGGGNTGGGTGSPDSTSPAVDIQPDAFNLAPATFDDLQPGESIEASTKVTGFEGSLKATFTTTGPITATLRNGKSGKEAAAIDLNAGDTVFVRISVNADAADGEAFSVKLTVSSGDNAVSASLKGTIRDSKDPALSIHFPPDRSVTNAGTISVTGSASDTFGIESIAINGEPANFDAGTGLWELAESSLANGGSNKITVEVKDASGRITQQVLDIFRYGIEGATLLGAIDADYLGGDLLPADDRESAFVDSATGKVYVAHDEGGGFTLVEVDPDTGKGREILKNALTEGGDKLVYDDQSIAVHNSIAYFYVLDAVEDDDDGIYRAVLSECTDPALLSCVKPFAINGEGAAEADAGLFYGEGASLIVRGDELWVLTAGDTNSGIENGGLVRIALEDGSMIETPKAIDAVRNVRLAMNGDTLYAVNHKVRSYNTSVTNPDATEAVVSTCDGDNFVASSHCEIDYPDTNVGAGPSLIKHWDTAQLAEDVIFMLAQSRTPATGFEDRIFDGLYAVDIANGDRNFLLGKHFDTGFQISRGEELPELATVKLIQDAQRQRLYVWDGYKIFAVNVAKVTGTDGTTRYALDTVRVATQLL